jgi:hypothetical protein
MNDYKDCKLLFFLFIFSILCDFGESVSDLSVELPRSGMEAIGVF